jgi:hypothetical protein
VNAFRYLFYEEISGFGLWICDTGLQFEMWLLWLLLLWSFWNTGLQRGPVKSGACCRVTPLITLGVMAQSAVMYVK